MQNGTRNQQEQSSLSSKKNCMRADHEKKTQTNTYIRTKIERERAPITMARKKGMKQKNVRTRYERNSWQNDDGNGDDDDDVLFCAAHICCVYAIQQRRSLSSPAFRTCFERIPTYMHTHWRYASKITHLFVSFSYIPFVYFLFAFNTLQILMYIIRMYVQMNVLHQRWVCARVHIGLSILHVSSFMFLLSCTMHSHIPIDGFLFRSWPNNYLHTLGAREREPHFIQFLFDELCTLCWCHSVHLQR